MIGPAFTLFPTPIGKCGIAWRDDLVIATRLPDARATRTAEYFTKRRNASEDAPSATIKKAITAITALLEGEAIDLTFIRCDLAGLNPFAAKIYATARALAPGETTTYGAIAAETGDKNDARKVGYVLGRNPFPIIVPCHRVLGAGGRLTGFSAPGGVDLKLRMLEIEGAQIGKASSLFDDLPFSLKSRR